MDYQEEGKTVIAAEIEALQSLHGRIGGNFEKGVRILHDCLDGGGKIIVVGVGKSGSIGRKLGATLNSTGAPSVILNAQDALHGDLGVVSDKDVVIALSYSGDTAELLELLPHIRRRPVKVIAITGGVDSPLGRNSDVVLDVHVDREACPLNLAPTASTVAMLAMGDALAMVLLTARGFNRDGFAQLHPGGSIGRALLTRVSDVMRSGDHFAQMPAGSTVGAVLGAMNQARCGAAVITDPDGLVAGVFTHGDFVRSFPEDPGIAEKAVDPFMTTEPVTIGEGQLAADLVRLLAERRIDDVVVLDEGGRPVGLVDTQDLSRQKLV